MIRKLITPFIYIIYVHIKGERWLNELRWRGYLQSQLTITILLAEDQKKEMIGKLEISDRKDRNLERFQTAFSALPSRPNGYGSRPLAQGQTGIALSIIRSYLQFRP